MQLYPLAEPLLQESLQIRESKLEPDHPDVAQSLNNLAVIYDSLGQYAKSKPLHERALKIRELKLGPNHPDVAVSLNNLAGLCQAMGQYAEAEPLVQRSLKIREIKLGRDHPDVAQSLANLAESTRRPNDGPRRVPRRIAGGGSSAGTWRDTLPIPERKGTTGFSPDPG